MTPDAADTIRAKLNSLSRFAEELADKVPTDPESYTSSRSTQLQVERLSQLCVEASTDALALVSTALSKPVAPSSREAYRRAQEMEVITQPTADRFQQTYVPFRNILVHDYDEIDNLVAYYSARRLADDARQLVGEVAAFVAAAEAPSAEDQPVESP